MARGFKRKGRGAKVTYAANLDEFERQLLVELFGQVEAMLDDGTTDVGEPGAAGGSTTSGQGAVNDEFDRIVAGLGEVAEAAEAAEGEPTSSSQAGGAAYATDPAIRRLLPSGNRADDELAAEFRRLTEQSLRQRKLANLRTATTAIEGSQDDIRLARPEALALLVALTDVRLVLGTRIGLETDEDAARLHLVANDADPDDPFAQAAAIYEFLTWLQETLAGCLTP